ncbi:Osmotin thaumatin-like protein [Coniophora puteana RWD-64-598 SS2]|uniref:Osmotin thaumatin-like protein n=1 Tax=Coniophora puteana (strain RWD-64-598) TaxID=741705 RepID=A0A5M3MUC7_CONPW|nr:Osmotin thaumatin-like protein [Coniophora puteana RWD-64-598 SS2]EIW82729.1 Osmotin thaumatin-like protein [Coniophora puteana RWD-64-598 SS2]
MKTFIGAALAAALVGPAAAFNINFQNNCGYTIWPAIGKAPNGVPDTSVAYGTTLGAGASASYSIADTEVGIRAWGRTGCDSTGANCATGNCNGGLVCTDGGITAGVILSEYGYGDYGSCCGGDRITWDLSIVDSSININTELSSSDGQSVTCTQSSCPADQAFDNAGDSAADRNSALGVTFTHTFCP